MQKHTGTTILLLLKKKNEHQVLVVCARSKKKCFFKVLKKTQGYSGKFKVTQEIFLTQSGNPAVADKRF